jgi:hypothetical protein
LPDYYQRFALGNNYFPVSQLEKQRMTDIEIGGKYPIGKHEAGLNYEYVSCVNNYWFVDSVWTKDILNSIQYHSISARASFNFGAWHVQPEYIFTHDRFVLNIIPFHQLRTRIFVKGGIFKARKLIGYAGLDFSAVSSYTWKGFNYFNASFALKNNGLGGVGWTNLHVFGGFQIDEFKFYFRVENLGYIWNDRNLELQSGFPIPSTQFRLGVTWDFFN